MAFLAIFSFFSVSMLIYFFADSFSSNQDYQILMKVSSLWQNSGLENQSVYTSLKAQEVAPIDFDTFLGTGFYHGWSATGSFSRSDTGYLQCYFGYGLMMTIFFYSFLYFYFIKSWAFIKEKKLSTIMLFFFFAIVIGEGKEPYIHHFGEPFVFLMVCLLCEKENSKLICEGNYD